MTIGRTVSDEANNVHSSGTASGNKVEGKAAQSSSPTTSDSASLSATPSPAPISDDNTGGTTSPDTTTSAALPSTGGNRVVRSSLNSNTAPEVAMPEATVPSAALPGTGDESDGSALAFAIMGTGVLCFAVCSTYQRRRMLRGTEEHVKR